MYSFLGYIVEILSCTIVNKTFTFSRGFLIGPVIPVFGVGVILLLFLLYKYREDVFALFIMSLFICSILEYITSYLMEKIFKLRWWDYSDRKMNLNGRICLSNAILFGIGGVFVIQVINPFFLNLINLLPNTLLYIISLFIFILFLIDIFVSLYFILNLKIDMPSLGVKDATSIIKREIRRELKNKSFFTKRLVNSFPHLINKYNYSRKK